MLSYLRIGVQEIMNRSPHLSLAKKYWKEHLKPQDVAIDATCGNGQDTLFLCKLGASVFAMDVQDAAIERTKALLVDFSHFNIIKKSHDRIDELLIPKAPRLIVYNLGYLPGGDKSITTQTKTTLRSLEKSLNLIDEESAISVTCYPGHPEGAREEKAIIGMLSNLPSGNWSICYHKYLNRESSPTLIWIKKES